MVSVNAVASGCAHPADAAGGAAEASPVKAAVPFDALCNDGRAVTSKNWLCKLWRYTIVPTKELYLPFMFSGLPTNYLMVRPQTDMHACFAR
jgi:hypothetical protein